MPRRSDAVITPNNVLAAARKRLPSPHRLGQYISRPELADAVNRALDRLYPKQDRDSLYVDARWVGKLERGESRWPVEERRAALREVFGVQSDAELSLYVPRWTDVVQPSNGFGPVSRHDVVGRPGSHDTDSLADDIMGAGLTAAEKIRLRVESALGDSDLASESIDEWEGIVTRHARATRYRPATVLLAELLADSDGAQQLLQRRHTAFSLRRATRIVAQMAGLVSLTLLKLDEASAAQQWGRTARAAAAGCGDPATSAWVWAQEAHRYFYANDWGAAIDAAETAQDQVRAGSVGTVLAAALEARARAVIGDAIGTRAALGRAEDQLATLDPPETAASALGYDEAQLRFHAGNAFTHLGAMESARAAQDRALELYPVANYLDRTLIYLDQAACLVQEGDVAEGARFVVDVLRPLPPQQLDRLVVARAKAIVGPASARNANVSEVRAAKDFLKTIEPQGRS